MQTDVEIRAALKAWRDGLVGLTRQSALIKFRAARTSSLLIEEPGADEVLARLQSRKLQAFQGRVDLNDPEAPRPHAPGTFFAIPRPDKEVGPVVRSLMRRANAEFLDRGLAVLYFAFGILDWKDLDGTEMVSPLFLVPVELVPEGPKSTPRVTLGDADPVLNPALSLRLREFGVELPTSEDMDGLSVSETLRLIRLALDRQKAFSSWSIREATYLSTFSFAKEAMFKDLLDNEARILEHPIVRAIATSDPSAQTGEFQFEPIHPDDIDHLAPPELTPLVLDGDSSQRSAIAAAVSGKTFVMDGPPGTGKSQTIANAIGALLHAGKTVLFVSEKMAALDVVRNRLAAAGLGSYLLELHSHRASRKEVAAELLRTLDNVSIPPMPLPSLARAGAKDRREQLNNYADAMNAVRQPLNATLHDVLGRTALLSKVPVAPVPDNPPTDLSEADYRATQDALARLVRNWRPAAQGKSFLWLDVEDDQSLEVRLYQAQTALEELEGRLRVNSELLDVFGATHPSDTPRVIALLTHQHQHRPTNVPDAWLMAETTAPHSEALGAIEKRATALESAEAAATSVAGESWKQLPDLHTAGEPSHMPVSALGSLEIYDHAADVLAATADRLEREAEMLRSRLVSARSVATSLGLGPVETFADVERVCLLADLRSTDVKLDERWFSVDGITQVRTAAADLERSSLALQQAEARANEVFTHAALQAPLAELQERFSTLHKGLRKLSGGYRADKRAVAGLLNDAADVKNGIGRLSDAIAWGDASTTFTALAREKSEWLGSHWRGRETDYQAAAKSFRTVDEALRLTEGSVPKALARYLTDGGSHSAVKKVLDETQVEFALWSDGLRSAPSLTGRPELRLGGIEDAAEWLASQVEPLRQAVARIHFVDSAIGRKHTLREAEHVLSVALSARRARVELQSVARSHSALFGVGCSGGRLELERLKAALAWVDAVRDLVGGPLTLRQLEELQASHPVDLAASHERWTTSKARVVAAFNPSRHGALEVEFDDFRGARELLGDFQADTTGQQEWFEYRRALADLTTLGLDAAIDFCIQQKVAANEVPDVVLRALLRSWSDHVIQSDGRLRPLLAADREALIEEYRNLDRGLIEAATSDIILAANTRRPVNTSIGESGVIRREGSKQKRHKPVRDLIASSRTVTQAIKPIFMMSPLAVSQYLPSDIEFDVVIFDEASQVTPGDAINCIYRGNALVLAGDDRQLPPTSFFERNIEDEDDETDVQDFQSVLELAKASGAFNNLGLRWHYRSRHEGLIEFSNYKFYEGKLITFPSAQTEGTDIGVEFFHAHGMYKRGGGAFNPIEAAKVAERVIQHFTNAPDLTLGVVTFSVAQADAVQRALDDARVDRRDLDRFFDSDDRLDGFFIRALEQVQGDERDVIILSVGYGPDEAGRISTNFGALNKEKGWRRLNVAITRARQRVEVVASMRAGEIPPSTNENVEYLRAYLDYADRGQSVLAVPYSSTGLDPESPFEESVLTTLRDWGFVVEPQVGAAGYRIDLAVRHPAYPGLFAVGIECDGYQYHSAPAARDRDRLRDQVLTGLGWRLHRIWGTAWYRDRATEERRLRSAIQHAIDAPLENRTKEIASIERNLVQTVEAEWDTTPTWATPYVRSEPQLLPYWVDPSEPANYLHMVEPINALVAVEGPIHHDLVFQRLRDWWGIGRIGHNIRAVIEQAIGRANVLRSGDFLLARDMPVAKVRTPTSGCVRKVDQIHRDEIALAVTMLLRDVGAADFAEVLQSVARLFGWARTGAIVDRRISGVIDDLILNGDLRMSTDGVLSLAH